jgi:hypothetical protein
MDEMRRKTIIVLKFKKIVLKIILKKIFHQILIDLRHNLQKKTNSNLFSMNTIIILNKIIRKIFKLLILYQKVIREKKIKRIKLFKNKTL